MPRLRYPNGYCVAAGRTWPARVALLGMRLFCLALPCCGFGAAHACLAADTLVVCPAEFRVALAPWITYRERQGHTLEIIDSAPEAELLRQSIRKAAGAHADLHYLLLVGDAPDIGGAAAQGPESPAEEPKPPSVPVAYIQAEVNIEFGSEPTIPTDNYYADLNDDRVPELATGRIPCQTPEELTAIVRKILDYEQQPNFDEWRRRVHFVAGVGGFSPLIDSVIEASTKQLICAGIPPGYQTSMTYANWRSPYCPPPAQFGRICQDRLNEGGLFWIYIGHGHWRFLDQIHVPGADYEIMEAADISEVACENGSPIAIFLACYTGAFDAQNDCLGELLLRQPKGPVAVLSGTRVTLPYGMAIMSKGMLEAVFVDHQGTLGDVFLAGKKQLASDGSGDGTRLMLDTMARIFHPGAGDILPKERREHLDLFHLLGDPLLRIRYPEPITLEVPAAVTAGETLRIHGRCPVEGPCRLELIVSRDRLAFDPPLRTEYSQTPAEQASYLQVYQNANDGCLLTVDTQVSQGEFTAELKIPAGAVGTCHVRAFVTTSAPPSETSGFAIGAADVVVEPQPKPETAKPASGE